MSGGSFNYLCYKVNDGDLPESTIEEMAKWLRLKGKISAADKTERVLFHLKQARCVAEELESVWHAAEWWCSGDYGEDQLDEAISEAGL